MTAIKIYGVPFSQPVRAVIWLLFLKRMPFDLILTNPGTKGENGSRNPNYLAKNPSGTIPCLEEPDTGFTVGEAHAIMKYLALKHRWTDLYPEDLQRQAKIDWYFNFHHGNVRQASGLVAPKIRKDLVFPEAVQENSRRTITMALETLNEHCLSKTKFLVSDQLTLADLAAYVEIGQMHPRFTNVYDFSPFENVQRWLEDMTEVDFHDQVHVVLSEIGDISEKAPSMETVKAANKNALRMLKETLAEF